MKLTGRWPRLSRCPNDKAGPPVGIRRAVTRGFIRRAQAAVNGAGAWAGRVKRNIGLRRTKSGYWRREGVRNFVRRIQYGYWETYCATSGDALTRPLVLLGMNTGSRIKET